MCNHVASIDDPLIVAGVVPAAQLLHSGGMRWTLCATDRCSFHQPLLAAFFKVSRALELFSGVFAWELFVGFFHVPQVASKPSS